MAYKMAYKERPADMPKTAREMSALDIKRAAHPGGKLPHQIPVGGVSGLMLQITRAGSKYWLLRVVIGGKRHRLGLGAYPQITLAEARNRARDARAKIEKGVDPIAERRAVKAALAADHARAMTFSEAVKKWLEAKAAGMPDKRRAYIEAAFARYAAPEIGKMDLQEIRPQDIARVLSPIWAAKHETAAKLRARIEAVLSWATVAGYRQGDNPARWAGNLRELLPRPDAVATVEHYPAVALPDLPSWWAALSKRDGTGARALRFLAMTAARSGEVRGATWDEIDAAAGLWIIPAARMKAKKDHRVPLTPAALALLKSTPRLAGSPLIFPAARGGQLSDMTVGKVMRDMQAAAEKAGGKGWLDRQSKRPAVPHGLRSSFRDWCADTGVDRDLAEVALAHAVGSDVERAYRRSDMIERRRAVMAAWQAALIGGDVLPFRKPSGIAA